MTKSKKSKTEGYLKDYKLLKELYRDFSYTVKFLLENLLQRNDFKYQAITYREKSEKSLIAKLEEPLKNINGEDTRNTLRDKINSIQDVDDLAGCRIIFYLDNDIQRAIQYLRNEFVVVKQNLKYSDDSYNALHLIIKLNKDRLKLSEYERFSGLKCEIQLTTVLYHSWSELAHDVIYKPEKSFSEFDRRAFDSIKGRFSDVMKSNIKPAQYSFEYIFKEIEKIKQGKQVFDVNFLKSIINSESNNEIYENLKILLRYIEEFGDKTPKELKIIEIINNTLEKSKTLKKEPIRTAFGDFPGHDYADIAKVCLNILDNLVFDNPKEVFELLSRLSVDENEKIKKKVLDIASKIAEYVFWPKENKIYYHLQLFVLNEIEKWDDKDLLKYLDLTTKLCEKFLSPSFEGTSQSDYKTFTLHRGALPADDTIEKIRERSINILKKLYSLSETIFDKQKVLLALAQATYIPDQDYTDDLEKIILRNTNTLISFYSSIVKKADNEIIKTIEEQLCWFERQFQKGLKNLKELKSLINKDKEYGMYKVFVGWDYRYSEEMGHEEAGKERKQKIDQYIKQITQENISQWQKKILSIIKNYEQIEDRGQFEYFNIFLYELGKQKPEIAEKVILKNEEALESFLIHLVAGIWESKQKANAKRILENWTSKGKHLPACAYIFEYIKEVDEVLLIKIYKKAKEKSDLKALTNIIYSIVGNFKQSNIGKDLFINCVKELKKYEDYGWVYRILFWDKSVFEALDKNDRKVILDSLLVVQDIDYDLEEILSVFAQNSTKEVIHFFHERVKVKAKKKREEKYDAIPYRFQKLNESLSENAEVVVKEILEWFKEENSLYYWEGSHLLKAIFPAFHKELEKQLIELLKSKNKNKAKIVWHILRSYKGEVFLHKVCKEFIRQYPNDKKYQQEMFFVLSKMGVVSGEYGFVEGYKGKKKEIQEWKNDKNRVVKKFAQEYEDYLSKRIEYEKKRADEDIEISKREFEE